MKKVGKLTEARMVLPPEPKIYPMVSDRLFEGKVKRKKKLKEVEVPDPSDLPSNRPPQASLSTTNKGPDVNPRTYQVGNSMTDAKDPNLQELTPAGEQAAKLRAKEKRFDASGSPFDAGRMRGRRQHNISVRLARPKTPPAGRVPDKSYREDPV